MEKVIETNCADVDDSRTQKNMNLSRYRMSKKPKLVSNQRNHLKIAYETPVKNNSTINVNATNIQQALLAPVHWRAVLNNLREMRKHFDAPVDSMGCEKCHDKTAPPNVIRYQKLLSLILSSQTKDEITYGAMKKLIDHGCNIENILLTSNDTLGELIRPVGFWKKKVIYIKNTSEILKNQYNNDIPNTVKDLCTLPGVGPKIAHLCMSTCWNEVTGIGVDTHVHRISNRLGWVTTKTVEKTRIELQKWLPRELWKDVNHLLVGFGQQICLPIKPQCSTCLNRKLCPYSVKSENVTKEK